MMQWLRKNSKQIMVVVVLLAMFSFVGAQGLYELLAPNPASDVIMEAFGEKITRGQYAAAAEATFILENVGYPWRVSNDREFNVRHWFLLTEEARRAGIVPSTVAVEGMMKQLNEQFESRGGIDELRSRLNRPITAIRAALELKNMEVQNAVRVVRATMPSEPEVRQYARDTNEKVTIKAAVFDAKKFVDPEQTFTDDEMQAHFEQYRDVNPDESESGIGYRFPRRVTIQYVVADPATMSKDITIDLEKIKDHWKNNKEDYKKTIEVETPPDALMGPDEPTTPKTEQVTMKFSEARSRIENELKNAKAKDLARQAMNKLADELARPWASSATDKSTGYRPIPEGVSSQDYLEKAVNEIQSKFGVKLRYETIELANEAILAEDRDLGRASMPGEGDQSIGVAELAFRVPGFYAPAKDDQTSARLQLFQTPASPLAIQTAGGYTISNGRLVPLMEDNGYVLFRVVEAREAAAPQSLDDVRDKVVKNMRELAAYERMEDVANEFTAVARKLGAERALTMFDELRTDRGIRTLETPKAFARMSPSQMTPDELKEGKSPLTATTVPGIGKSQDFVDSVFAMTSDDWAPEPVAVDGSEKVAQATTQPAPDTEPKIQLVNLPDLRKRVVVELAGFEPVDINKYETDFREKAFQRLLSLRANVAQQIWYDPENIKARCDYVELENESPQEKAEGAVADPDDGENA